MKYFEKKEENEKDKLKRKLLTCLGHRIAKETSYCFYRMPSRDNFVCNHYTYSFMLLQLASVGCMVNIDQKSIHNCHYGLGVVSF